MTATFSIDVFDAEQKRQLQQYTDLITCTYTGADDYFHDYEVTILSGKRTRPFCELLPPDAATDPALGRPPRICHVLSNGIHAHQYELLRKTQDWPTPIKTRVLRLIPGVPPSLPVASVNET